MWSALFVVCALILIYYTILRPILQRIPALKGVYDLVDKHRAGRWAKVRVSLSGVKRILFSRIVTVAGVLLTFHDLVLANMESFRPLIPEKYQIYLMPSLIVLGAIFEYLTKISPQPEGQVNPGVIAAVTNAPVEVIAQVTAPDPIVAAPVEK